jgi:hypothetical protein
MKKCLRTLVAAFFFTASAQGQGLVISEILANPSGTDSPFEYVELVATQSINFTTTPYTIVFTNNGTATSNGWKAGGAITYAFQISSGSVSSGQVVYVGGSSMLPLSNGGTAIRSINTSTTNGDNFGTHSSDVLGNGGSNCDGVAVFDITAASLSSSTVPVDAVFFGTAVGSAFKTTTSGYQLPVNDKYSGGKLLTTSYVAPDPGSADLVKATTGTFNTVSHTWTTSRSWSVTSTPSYTTTSITISGGTPNNPPTLAFLPAASKLVDEASGKISCVKNNTTDPVIISGLDINVTDEDLATLTFQMTSSKTSVVANANFTVTGTGNARKFKITPAAAGYATITLKVTDNIGQIAQLSFSLAVSVALSTTAVKDVYHTGMSDGSTAVAIDSNYMFVADDETNQIRLVDRKNSGLPIYALDVTSLLALSGTELDIEASFRSTTLPNRIYWLGSMSNNKDGDPRPDRNRLFATDIVGSGATATLSFVGYYSNLRSKLIAWGDANGYNFTAKAASGVDPKTISGFNVEGFEMGPDGTTAYIGFRAPYVGSPQNKGLICPLTNFETWFNNGAPSGNPTFGSPIELNLGTRGIRSLGKNASNNFIIVAGGYDDTGTFALYSWNGFSASAPVLQTTDLTGLRPEGIAEVPASISGTYQLQLISDLGSTIWYNDGTENKDLTENNYKKYMSSVISVGGSPRPLDVLDIAENNLALSAYPNPTQALLTIELNQELKAASFLMIYNMQGKLMKQISINKNESRMQADMSGFATGIYLINVQGTGSHLLISKQ